MHYIGYRLVFIILKTFDLWSTSNIMPRKLLRPNNFTRYYNFFLIEFFFYVNLNPSFESWYIIFYFNGRIYIVLCTNPIIINVLVTIMIIKFHI